MREVQQKVKEKKNILHAEKIFGQHLKSKVGGEKTEDMYREYCLKKLPT